MTGQLHITHRADYLRGRQDGQADASADRGYRPGGHDGSNGQRAYSQGYGDGYAETHPCNNGTCDHAAHSA